MTDNIMFIAVQEARPACAGKMDVVLRLKKAMAVTSNFWMSTDDQLRLKAACGAAMMESNEADKDRIARSFKALTALSAGVSGIPIDYKALGDQMTEDLIPILKLWRDVKAERVRA